MEDSRDAVSAPSSDDGLSRPPKVRRVGKLEDVPPRTLVSAKEGQKLMQLFSVRFVDYERVKSAEIYGVIFLECAGYPYLLFERFPGDPLPVDPDGFVKLTDPNMVHHGYDRIEFISYLFDLKENLYPPYQNIWYGSRDEKLLLCNKLLVKRSDTMVGPIELGFAVFTESVGATLEVKLLDWKEKGISNGTNTGPASEIEVFGEMTSRVMLISDASAKSYMFKREEEMCALVRPGEAIPLARCYTVFPIRSSIVLHVALYHRNLGGHDLIVDDHVEVPAIQIGDEFVLESDCARIQLKYNDLGTRVYLTK